MCIQQGSHSEEHNLTKKTLLKRDICDNLWPVSVHVCNFGQKYGQTCVGLVTNPSEIQRQTGSAMFITFISEFWAFYHVYMYFVDMCWNSNAQIYCWQWSINFCSNWPSSLSNWTLCTLPTSTIYLFETLSEGLDLSNNNIRIISTRGIRKRAKIDLPISAIQKWQCLDEQHHTSSHICLDRETWVKTPFLCHNVHEQLGADMNNDVQACMSEVEEEGQGHVKMRWQMRWWGRQAHAPPHPTTLWDAQPHQLMCVPLSRGCRESGGVQMQVPHDTMHAFPSHYFVMYFIIIIMSL